jgi:pimeloyl-ACP methyl ester carboxylesterase
MAMPETQYARAGDAHIAYQVFGQGETDLVWMPHWATHIEMLWEDPLSAAFFQGLASFSRVIMFDKRGVGLSDPVALAPPLTVESWTEDLSAVLDAVGSQRAAVAASDMAGFIAVLFAATHPDRTTALVLVNATARVRRAPDYPIGLPGHLADRLVAAYEEEWGTTTPTLGIMDPSVADNESYRAWVSRYNRATASPGTIVPMVRMVLDTDVRAVLPAVRVPTLVLHRADDAYVRADHGRYLADHIPGARYVELPGKDHTPELGDADSVVAQMQSFLTGDWPITGPERVLTTVVFTDIVGSTARAAELGDRRWKELLDTYDRFVLRQLDRFRGRQVKSTGDGTLATVDGPRRAIACAVAIREGVRALGLEIRAGLHAGEVDLRGEDLAGIAVHLAERVCSSGGPGEILVTRTVVDLVAGSGITFEDRGEHELKGVPASWRLFAVKS